MYDKKSRVSQIDLPGRLARTPVVVPRGRRPPWRWPFERRMGVVGDDPFASVLAKFLPHGLEGAPAQQDRGGDGYAEATYGTPSPVPQGTPPPQRGSVPRVVDSVEYHVDG